MNTDLFLSLEVGVSLCLSVAIDYSSVAIA